MLSGPAPALHEVPADARGLAPQAAMLPGCRGHKPVGAGAGTMSDRRKKSGKTVLSFFNHDPRSFTDPTG